LRPNAEFIKDFIDEALAHISLVEDLLLRLEQGEYSDNAINEIFRAVHSIKGAAGLFNFAHIAQVAHTMETLFGAIREKNVPLSSSIIDAVFSSIDLLKEMIRNFEDSDSYNIDEHVRILESFLIHPIESAKEPEGNLWDLWDKIASEEVQEIPEDVDSREEVGAKYQGSEFEKIDTLDGKKYKDNAGKEESIRVSVGVLNELLNLAGEMVLRRNQLLRLVESGAARTEELQSVAKGIDLVTTALQERVMKARMQPVSNLFNRFPRIVRELSRKLGKEIDLRIEGAQVELDKSIIEALSDPLIHIVRNSIDHGIEPAHVREEQKKPYLGTVVLRAYHEAGKVIIEVEDDGIGIEPEKISAKALSRGIVTEQQLAVMSEREIIHLIMRPGFSTADHVTELSGRGVGMDVVKTNIEKLGGKIDVLSTPGIGSVFRLALPLTLAIIPALIVRSRDFTAAIPQANLHELVLLQPDDEKRRIELVHGYPVLRLRDRLLPLLRLTDITGDTQPGLNTGTDEYFQDREKNYQIVVLKCGDQIFALEVDQVYDHEEILVKPLPPILQDSSFYLGSTVLGDGRIAFILDPEEIKIHSDLRFTECKLSNSFTVKSQEVRSSKEEQELLLFRTAGGETLGVDITLVSRVETHEDTDIQRIKSKEYVVSRGKPLQIIRPEYHLPLARSKRRTGSVHVIILKLVKSPVAIVAREIIDVVRTEVLLNEDGVSEPGIIGSTLINGRIVLLLNIYELLEQALPKVYKKSVILRRENNKATLNPTPARVLLVEDMPFFAKVTKGYLEGAGLEVLLAADGQEALEVLNHDKVDLVISDIEMPVMNGFELIRAIRNNEQLGSLPVIALTSLNGEANREKGLRAGFDAYEYKLDRAELLKTAERFLNRA
jgi:two-component system chemotaxis sensor kinase CheA